MKRQTGQHASRTPLRRVRRIGEHHLHLALVLCIVLLLTTGSMPVVVSPAHTASPDPLTVRPLDQETGTANPAPLTEYEVEIPCQNSVYVDETNPSTNNNGALQGDYLRVGTSTEFCGQQWALLDIGPISESDGGPVPDGAEITSAQLKLRKESGPGDTIRVYGLMTGFNEASATWNTRPDRYGSPTANTAVSSANGWTYLSIPSFALSDAISYGHGLRVALCPTWTACSRSIAFYSDDHGYRPALVISYLGSGGEPSPPPPEPPEGDTEPCDLDIDWTSSHPSPGQMVTITATATDNVEMRYVAIYRGSRELARRDASPGQTELSVSYTEEAVLPSLSYLVAAKDSSVETVQVVRAVTIPVVGTGTAPEVNVEIEWEIEEVIPERYRLIRNDGQTATITATATDPEGIDYLEIHCAGLGEQQFDLSGENEVSRTVYWTNNQPTITTFSCYASAVDLEGNYTSSEPVRIDIAQPGDLRLMSTAAPGFHNPSRDRLPWERMVQTFGDGECYWGPDWKSWYALIWYHAGFKSIADGGECFGMSTMAGELYQSRIIANSIEPSATAASYMSYDNSFTKEYVEARQGGQIGEEVAFTRYHQKYVGTSEKLGWVEADLAADRPGVLSIREDDDGHAITPWMSRHMPDGTTRVYVYDSNREGGIVAGRDAASGDLSWFDLHNFDHYPYVEFDGSSWSYLWPDGVTWNDELAYFHYEEACGDMDQDNRLDGPFAPTLTDHDIPSVLQYLFFPIGGDADVLVEDKDGNMTGIYEGHIVEDIPDSMALVPMAGAPFAQHEMYILPIDELLNIHITGTGSEEYVFGLLGGGSLLAIEQRRLSPGSEDTITIERAADAVGHKMRVRLGDGDSDFTLVLAHMFEGYTAATDSDFIGREYIMEIASALAGLDFSVYVPEGGDSLAVENNGDEDLEFDATMRTTESLDEVDDPEEMPFIPASTEQDVRVGSGDTVELTPDNWPTTEEEGSLHVLRNGRESTPQGSSFPTVPVIIAGAAAAVVLGLIILLKKGIIRIGKQS